MDKIKATDDSSVIMTKIKEQVTKMLAKRKYFVSEMGEEFWHFKSEAGMMSGSFTVSIIHDGTIIFTGDYGVIAFRRDYFPKNREPLKYFPNIGVSIDYFAEKVCGIDAHDGFKKYDSEIAPTQVREALKEWDMEEVIGGLINESFFYTFGDMAEEKLHIRLNSWKEYDWNALNLGWEPDLSEEQRNYPPNWDEGYAEEQLEKELAKPEHRDRLIDDIIDMFDFETYDSLLDSMNKWDSNGEWYEGDFGWRYTSRFLCQLKHLIYWVEYTKGGEKAINSCAGCAYEGSRVTQGLCATCHHLDGTPNFTHIKPETKKEKKEDDKSQQ